MINEDIKVLYNGINNILIDGSGKQNRQRGLPMIPSLRLKRMKDDVEPLFKTIKEQEESKESIINELKDDLLKQVKDEDSDYDADDMREELNAKSEELTKEMDELMQEEVEVSFSDPVTEEDIKRIDQTDENFPFVSSSAIDIILTKVVD